MWRFSGSNKGQWLQSKWMTCSCLFLRVEMYSVFKGVRWTSSYSLILSDSGLLIFPHLLSQMPGAEHKPKHRTPRDSQWNSICELCNSSVKAPDRTFSAVCDITVRLEVQKHLGAKIIITKVHLKSLIININHFCLFAAVKWRSSLTICRAARS